MVDDFIVPGKKGRKFYRHDFTPKVEIGFLATAYAFWIKEGRPPPQPGFFEEVMMMDLEALAHLHWFDDIVEYRKTELK